jgi:putative CocE/NonD family hydrolase
MARKEQVFIPMSDGVRLAASLYFPKEHGPGGDGHTAGTPGSPWPAILEALPYRKDDLTWSYRPEYQRLADEGGYVVCRVDVRGTGSSEGVAIDEYPRQEQLDMVEVIEWLATQEWSSGSVGMYGTSYSGFNSIQVAMERPPALKAIIPIFATDDRYADDVHYFGGVLKALDLVDYPAYMVAMNALPPVPSLAGDGWRERWEERVASTEPWVLTWLENQRFGPYWQHGSLRPNYGAIEAATMIVAGWADGYTNNSLRTMAELRCPKRLVLGPWAHSSIETSDPGPNIDIVAEHLRWFDRWVKGVDNGVDREPEIVVFVRRSTRPAPDLAEVRGEWRFERGWPLDRGVELPLELEKAATPGREDVSRDDLEVRGDVGHTAWISCAGAMPWGQPSDQRPDEAYSLVYEWEALEEEVEILGHPRLAVTVSSSRPIAYLSAKLCDVFPDGTSALVTRGMLNLAHRDSRERPSPVEPGRPYAVTVELEVTSWVFERGHRIRLDLAGSDWPNAWPPPRPTTLTIDRVGSTLVLPVVDGESDIRERPDVRPPPRTVDPPPASAGSVTQEGEEHAADGENPHHTWRVEHDVLARETRAVVGNWGWTEAANDRPRYWEDYQGTVAVSTEDPGIARAEGRIVYRVEWPEATVVSEVRHRTTSDALAYHVWLELELSEDGATRWTRRWERTIPRDHQ